jgi:hypothetical protein
MSAPQSLRAQPRLLAAASIAAFLVIEVLLFVLTRIPSLLSMLAFAALSVAVAAGFAVDFARWDRRGTRCVELSDDALVLYAGRALVPRRIERAAVRGVMCRQRVGRKTAVIELRAGRKVRIHGDAFPPAAFSRFCTALLAWR